MARNIEAVKRDWIPAIIKTYRDNEELTTFDICKTEGRMPVGRDAHEHVDEVNRALDWLETNTYIQKTAEPSTEKSYWGVTFPSFAYTPMTKMEDLAYQIEHEQRKKMNTGITVNGNVTQMVTSSPGSTINLKITDTKTIDDETKKLLEDLKIALADKDKSKVKRVLSYLSDKGVDIVLQLVTGQFFQ